MSQSDKLSQHLWGVHLDSEMQLLLSLSLSLPDLSLNLSSQENS